MWRWAFAHSDVPSDASASLDDVTGLWSIGSILGGFAVGAVIISVAALFRPHNPVVLGAVIVAFLVSVFVVGGLALQRGTRVIDARFAAVRAGAREPAIAAGWHFAADGPLPSYPTREATFQFARGSIFATSLTDVTTGALRGHSFTAGHLEGTDEGTRRSENLVIMQLPALLPELRLRDRTTTAMRDYGISLPTVPIGDPAVETRWEVQSPYPEFARDLLDAPMREYLASIPRVPCTIVIRNGYLIACRDPEGSFASISARVDILIGLLERIPAICWHRETSAEVAGAGVRAPRVRLSGWLIFRR